VIGRIGFLADAGEGTVIIFSLFIKNSELWYPLDTVGQIDGTLWTYGSTLAAKCTSVFSVVYYPGKITEC